MPLIRRCLCRPLQYALCFSSSSSTTSPRTLGRVWPRSVSYATNLSFIKAPPPPGLQNGGHTKSQGWVMGSKNMLKSTSFAIPLASSSHGRLFHTHRLLFSAHSSKPISRVQHFSLKTNGFSYMSHANAPSRVYSEGPATNRLDSEQLELLKQKLEKLGLGSDICIPGQYNRLLCPKCKGGDSGKKSLSLFVTEDGGTALWTCFRATCGWKGSTRTFADSRLFSGLNQITKVKKIREITVENLKLEPLCDELVAYFADRLISRGTLLRNRVMQKRSFDKIAIAFTFWQNKMLVNCKYRDVKIKKRFWQEAGTEKNFYGLDDIQGKSEIIIVEGEMDKLAMEEAGFCNCVSVPDGAPPPVSRKELPPEEQDKKYQYLLNCKDYFQKASRIILATDGDPPGHALGEELAQCLGRERCWRVRWPKKNEVGHFKDANEVLMYLGADVLKEVIENAELYPT